LGLFNNQSHYLKPGFMNNKLLFKDVAPDRDPSFKETDRSALNALVQATVNVELFTIPLYMTSLYSLYGLHQITGQNNFYQGRMWPGMSTNAAPKTANDHAFNAIFSVFIAEMLHLQLASNICKAVGVTPSYTSPMLQTSNFGWKCYDANSTVIPHIIDFKDTKAPYNQIKVKLGPVDKEQLNLFLAIEETEEAAEKIIPDEKKDKYFPEVPFAGWQPDYDETNLPMFGSIGHMYLCLWEYLSITYTDDTTLWDYVIAPMERDLFNVDSASHAVEYPSMAATVRDDDDGDERLMRIKDMINGITDQGEGGGVIAEINARLGLLQKVKPNFQPDKAALEKDYPNYSDTGKPKPSRDAEARSHYGSMDHFETFQKVMELFDTGAIKTWDQWHAAGNKWTAEMLKTTGYDENLKNYPTVPKAEDIAGALNRLKENNKGDSNFTTFSQASAGAIAGVTTVLNTYWNNPSVGFPFPSMAGSGDRMSICWAIFGKTPELSLGIKEKQDGILYHACQGLNLDPNNPSDANTCAGVEVFHTCKGSNTCKAEGGCGFVAGGGCGASVRKSSSGGHGCGRGSGAAESGCGSRIGMLKATKSAAYKAAEGATANKVEATCAPLPVSAPTDNKCGGHGGCAVPISASQLFPDPNNKYIYMNLFDFGPGPDFSPIQFGRMGYKEGDMVYDKAWEAYTKVLENRQQPIPPNPPKPSDIRLALPPST
jgi:hypothetical protein